ncbi:MAG TPA: helix-turn-helix domain-containing protein [Chitinophagales bacterium]|nr:helix-turn-helix domain-containing protein [Chitinophagales bacterium]
MTNPEFELAEQFALYTHRHFFLTGKAGTGKTTLLRQIAQRTSKNFVVVAPTGVAAINAGGVTIHSMFGLPLTAFVPTNDFVELNLATNRRRLVDEHMKYRKDKLKVLQELDMLIIDEVSMVRADIIDAIDFVLRTVRRNSQPFGDVQVMLIGDMHQLPPVIKDDEWKILSKYYQGPYFFNSLVWQQIEAAEIELKTIYRQSDRNFVSLLNNVRHQQMDEYDYEKLQERYKPDFKPTEEGYVLLATHNNKANSVNENELRKLIGRTYMFEAEVEGDFPENMYPCDRVLQLKEGAQVMFIRNDSEEGKYYNGKLAVVKTIDGDDITVTFNDNKQDYVLHRETWENINYTVEAGTEKINKDVNGTFSQYPLRLAWAITIHKSQGLTFDNVIIDAGASFAAGQVYVALSRCRTLDGIVLHSMITPKSLHGDMRIVEFSDSHHSSGELHQMLGEAKTQYANYLLKRLFTFNKLADGMDEWKAMLMDKEIPGKDAAVKLYEHVFQSLDTINGTSRKFGNQLNQLIAAFEHSEDVGPVKERCQKAIEYFTENIFEQLIKPMHAHIQELAYKSKVKKYVHHVQQMQNVWWNKINQLYFAQFLDEKLYTGEIKYTRDKLTQVTSSVTSGKKEKGGTYQDTLDLHRKGISLKEIAEVRGLALSTIKGHMARWVLSGDVEIKDVLPADIIQPIEAFLNQNEEKTVSAVLAHFGEKYDGGDVRMVVNHVLRHLPAQ